MSPRHGNRPFLTRSRRLRPSDPERLEARDLPSGYTVTSLGTLGGPTSSASAINGTGEVVGAADTKRYFWVFDAPHDKQYDADAFLWKPAAANGGKGSMTDLNPLGGIESEAAAVNDTGQVVGRTDLPDGTHAFLFTPTTAGGTSGVMTDLGGLGGTTTYATAINNAGEVVGMSTTGSGAGHAFLWTPSASDPAKGSLTDLTSSAGLLTAAAINGTGQVLGTCRAADGTTHSCVWTPPPSVATGGSVLDLGSFVGVCMNDSGEVAGYVGSDLGLYANGRAYDLGSLPTGALSVAAISSTGSVVGTVHLSTGADHAFLWVPGSANGVTGKLADLDLLLGSSAVTVAAATGVNALGQIAGWGTVNNGLPQGLLLTPNTSKTQAKASVTQTSVTADPAATSAGLVASPADVSLAPAGAPGSVFDLALDQVTAVARHRKNARLF